MSTADRVLVVGPSWVGDMVMAQALYRQLAARRPRPEIHVLAGAWSGPVLARMPEVDRTIELPAGHGELALLERFRLGRKLSAERYTQAIVLPRSLKAALVPFFARARQRTGFRGEWRFGLINDMRSFDLQHHDQTVKRFLALGTPANLADLPAAEPPRLRVDAKNLARCEAALGLAPSTTRVALLPGAEFGPAKRWPAGHYAALAARLASAGLQVLVLGSGRERSIGAEVLGPLAPPVAYNLCGLTELADVVDLLSTAAVAVSNDSGLMHVAAAVGCHVVALYGSSSPTFTPPLTSRRHIFHLGLQCSPCHQRDCPLGHLRCLSDIGVESVFTTVCEVLSGAPGRLERGVAS